MSKARDHGSLPRIGAWPERGGTRFRVWAPDHERVELVLEGERRSLQLQREGTGYFSAFADGVAAGALYRYRLGDGSLAPDPASRFQPQGPHGPSEVVDAGAFTWTDAGWGGVGAGRHVLYEMHIGTFTEPGTWRAAAEQLHHLAELGITIVEIMPVAEFPGRFNWGYDGVAPFAPARVYGRPDDFRAFVDRAHALGLAVILDVVYNHMGPDGCYMASFAKAYFSERYTTDWGDAINFDGADSGPVRHFFLSNVDYWIREFHVDGYRVDATQNIYDAGHPNILQELTVRARSAAGERTILMIAENEPQDIRTVRRADTGGYGFDGMWNDDFHHLAMVALTGRTEAYYSDYRGTPQEFVSAAKWGFLYQGQHYSWQDQRRGTPAFDVPARCFINFLQNHDQVANSADGRRIHALASAAEYRAMTALLLLMPGTAMLFQGQEFGASAPFLFFADHEPELASMVHRGRREFLAQFPSAGSDVVQQQMAAPSDEATFLRSKLDPAERAEHHKTLALHRDLIRLSRQDPAFAAQDSTRLHGAVLSDNAFVLRFLEQHGGDRLLLVNLGPGFRLQPAPEPLLAPPAGMRWSVLWSSEAPEYGGQGSTEPERDDSWHMPGRAALVLGGVAKDDAHEDDDSDEDDDSHDDDDNDDTAPGTG
jgi:maltooligosyltrehalose trehalohydrolase